MFERLADATSNDWIAASTIVYTLYTAALTGAAIWAGLVARNQLRQLRDDSQDERESNRETLDKLTEQIDVLRDQVDAVTDAADRQVTEMRAQREQAERQIEALQQQVVATNETASLQIEEMRLARQAATLPVMGIPKFRIYEMEGLYYMSVEVTNEGPGPATGWTMFVWVDFINGRTDVLRGFMTDPPDGTATSHGPIPAGRSQSAPILATGANDILELPDDATRTVRVHLRYEGIGLGPYFKPAEPRPGGYPNIICWANRGGE